MNSSVTGRSLIRTSELFFYSDTKFLPSNTDNKILFICAFPVVLMKILTIKKRI